MLSSTKKDIFSGSGALATFSGKIEMAYYLGHIAEEEYKELNTIRQIRNEFAHAIDHTLAFDTPRISDKIQNLYFPKLHIESFGLTVAKKRKFLKPRSKFETSFSFLAAFLSSRGDSAKQANSPQSYWGKKV